MVRDNNKTRTEPVLFFHSWLNYKNSLNLSKTSGNLRTQINKLCCKKTTLQSNPITKLVGGFCENVSVHAKVTDVPNKNSNIDT